MLWGNSSTCYQYDQDCRKLRMHTEGKHTESTIQNLWSDSTAFYTELLSTSVVYIRWSYRRRIQSISTYNLLWPRMKLVLIRESAEEHACAPAMQNAAETKKKAFHCLLDARMAIEMEVKAIKTKAFLQTWNDLTALLHSLQCTMWRK